MYSLPTEQVGNNRSKEATCFYFLYGRKEGEG